MDIRYVYITVDDAEDEVVPIARESDEATAIQSGEDEQIYGYAPDDVFEMSDNDLSSWVQANLV